MISVQNIRCVVLFILLGISPGALLAAGELTEISMGLGYRVNSLDWNISGGSGGPNILSELEWRDLDILRFAAQARHTSRVGVTFRGNVAYGWVLDGINRDSDYAGNNRSLEFSRSVNAVEGSRMLDWSAGFGRTVLLGESDRLRLIPMVGYSYHSQKLQMNSANQMLWNSANAVIFDPALGGSRPLGTFAGLYSSYSARWSGQWLGTDIIWQLQGGGTLFARAETHWVNYYAEANWNLRSDLAQPVSFDHDASGRGGVLTLGWRSASASSFLSWGVSVNLQSWITDAGVDRTFSSGGTIGVTRLNEVNWSSRSINFTLQKSFAN